VTKHDSDTRLDEYPTDPLTQHGLKMLEETSQLLCSRLKKNNPPKIASRDNTGKAEWDYIFDFPTAMEALCRVMEVGSVKYERDDWKQGGRPDHEYISAMGRHISAFKQGDMFDPDTGCLHLAHALWNIIALIELNYPGVTHDSELFAKMKERWEKVKEEKRLATEKRRDRNRLEGERIAMAQEHLASQTGILE